jgi:hypothetical protein
LTCLPNTKPTIQPCSNGKPKKNFFLLQEAEGFLNLNNINLKNTTLWDPGDTASIKIDLTDEGNGEE